MTSGGRFDPDQLPVLAPPCFDLLTPRMPTTLLLQHESGRDRHFLVAQFGNAI